MTQPITNAGTRPAFRRQPSGLDTLFIEVNKALEVLSGAAQATRANPAGEPDMTDPELNESEKKHVAGLMRVNHVGEVCAQALYRGQSIMCKDPKIKRVLLHAAEEEVDHLSWCHDRLGELKSHTSLLNPLWYAGSFTLGVMASVAGVPKNLGFMAETERQVEQHLESHLVSLPEQDARSRKIVTQMRDDEVGHRTTAEVNGAEELPAPVKQAMRFMSKIMTTLAYRL
ncbi:2-polyprenyl-3-methyl-6-methoxy-1,4-benzoquinone monooxygenase [Advenella sp. WQ 585]|uniref:3-demethoxyubiquinol 3-hydroxylase n=1 Tax=Advenella mandrilli TaxID=2800330 RepID=A0ABS1EEL5_9BURK|nr:2-polyprenyl-3-methyl-6-methoxy-1,4-benzoquinone monooxygenase [Advenella mandrilli]MBK1781653.1 2-polyprenyl-3-methyl-6-methoxy-1,4-benzoquinone monooxygenase [Advenella mandrilli]MDY0273661.1 2-polyprenyl-3-methyl-6-methoxy-1,4-benzoquinone monooxygenase [Advenella sp.]